MRRALMFAPLLALLLGSLALGVLLARAPEAARPEAIEGLPAPTLARPTLASVNAGSEAFASLDQLAAGRPVVVNLFASWCAPCRVEHPFLSRLAGEGVVVIGVAWRDAPFAAQSFLDELGDPFEAVLVDRDGGLGTALGVTGAPETYVLNADGVVTAAWRGPLDERVLAGLIRPAVVQAQAEADARQDPPAP